MHSYMQFLFGVMFGDIGHGTLMLLGALFFVLNEKKLEKVKLSEIISPAVSLMSFIFGTVGAP
jgi:vacuolar-type H+-ATPase subunit I/STV1